VKRNYKVRYAVAGHDKGALVTDKDFAAGVNTQALVDGGFLTVEEIEPQACPACIEQGMKRPPRFEKLEELREHYAEKHAGLQPPTEEDLADG
jgi:hypothetical protein